MKIFEMKINLYNYYSFLSHKCKGFKENTFDLLKMFMKCYYIVLLLLILCIYFFVGKQQIFKVFKRSTACLRKDCLHIDLDKTKNLSKK